MIHLSDPAGKKPGIQISPLLDMVFLLLVFFVVCTMYMSQQQGVAVALPQSAGRILQETTLEITLAKNGAIYYQNEQVSPEQLLQKARQAAQADPRQTVTLRADKELSYGRVMAVLGQLRQSGLTEFSLAVEAGSAHE